MHIQVVLAREPILPTLQQHGVHLLTWFMTWLLSLSRTPEPSRVPQPVRPDAPSRPRLASNTGRHAGSLPATVLSAALNLLSFRPDKIVAWDIASLGE